MMLNRQITTTSYGQRYTFRLRNSGSLPKSLSPEKFPDLGLAYQLVRTLKLPESHWRSFTHFGSTLDYEGWRSSNPGIPLEKFIAICLFRGELQAYKVDEGDFLKSNDTQTLFKDDYGKSFHFFPAVSLLTSKPKSVESVTTKDAAQAVIHKLNLTKPQIIELNKGLNLPCDGDYSQLNDVLAEAIAESEVIIVTEEPHLKTSPDGGGESEAASNAGADNTPHPEAAGGSANDEDKDKKKDEDKVICKLTKLKVACEHGRSQEITSKSVSSPTLQVVAGRTGESKSLLKKVLTPFDTVSDVAQKFDKVTATIEVESPCGFHPNNSSTIMPKPPKTVKGSFENVYHLGNDPVKNPLRFLWLPSIKPRSYKIAASSCERFSPASINVEVFPEVAWNIKVGYSLASASKADGTKDDSASSTTPQLPEDKRGGFSGEVVFKYNGGERKFTAKYKAGIDAVLSRLEWVRDKVDSFLKRMSEHGPVKLEVSWPQLNIEYATSLAEDKTTPHVVTTYDLTISANPLIGIKGSFDAFPIIFNAAKTASKANPAAAAVVSVLEAALEGIGEDKSFASFKADIQLVFTIGSTVSLNFKSSGSNGRADGETRSETAIAMNFEFKGVVGVKGHVWVFKYEKNYQAGIKTGFVGKAIIEKDNKGFYWYSQFTFNGVTVFFTSYEKLEKNVQPNDPLDSELLGIVPDEVDDSSTREFTWLKSEPDNEAPIPANRRYIIEF